jgi:hypothetical protein
LAARFVRDEEAAGSNPATPTQVRRHVIEAQARFTEDLLAGAAVVVRAAVAARSAKTEALALTSVPTPAANVPSAVMAVQP